MNQLFKISSIVPSAPKPHPRISSSSSYFQTLISYIPYPHSCSSKIFPSSSNYPRAISKPTSNDQITPLITQFRPFSTDKWDPIDPRDPNASKPIDAGSSIRKPVSLWPGVYHSPVTNALWEARSSIFEKAGDVGVGSSSQDEDGLVPKTPSQSRTSIEYKFSTDYVLREQYRNPWNEIRMGKLVEDLDALAGTISYKDPLFW